MLLVVQINQGDAGQDENIAPDHVHVSTLATANFQGFASLNHGYRSSPVPLQPKVILPSIQTTHLRSDLFRAVWRARSPVQEDAGGATNRWLACPARPRTSLICSINPCALCETLGVVGQSRATVTLLTACPTVVTKLQLTWDAPQSEISFDAKVRMG